MQIIKKATLSLALIAALTGVCSAENIFTYATKGSHHSMDPMSVYDVPTHAMGVNVYDGLVQRDENLALKACLATKWENTSDLVWRFTLRQNVKFHDGSPFSADDVVFTYARATSKGSDLKGAVGSIAKIVKIDDFTVDVYTKTKNPILPSEIYSLPIFSKKWCEEHKATEVADATSKEEGYADRHTNGTGPFKLEVYKADVETRLVKNQDWWGGAENIALDKVIFKPVASDSTRMAGLLSGEFDLIAPVPLQDIKRAKNNSGLKILEANGLLTVYLGMNQYDDKLKTSDAKTNPFKDKRVRQAFYQAINIDGIHKKIMRGFSRPSGTIIGTNANGYNADIDQRYPYDVEAAKKLMKEAGYPDGFTITLNCSTDRYVKDEMICQAIAQMLAKIGVKVNLVAETKSKYFQKALSYNVDFYMLGWMPSTYDAHDAYYNILMTRKGGNQGKYNIGGYSNDNFDKLIEKVGVEMNPEKRNKLLVDAGKIVHEDVGILPLHQEKLVWGIKKKWDIKIRPDDFILLQEVNIAKS